MKYTYNEMGYKTIQHKLVFLEIILPLNWEPEKQE